MSKLPPMYLNPPVMRAQLRSAHVRMEMSGAADRAATIQALFNLIEDATGLVLPRERNRWDHTRQP